MTENTNKDKEMEKKYVRAMLENDLFAVVYPKEKTEEAAQILVNEIDSAVGIAEFKDENDNSIWGILIDKKREAEKQMKINPPIKKIKRQ